MRKEQAYDSYRIKNVVIARGDVFEQLIKKALDSVRRMKMAAFGKATPVEKPADDYAEPTKEEILAGLRNALQDVKDLREGKDVGHKFRDLSELLNEV
jgi:hypothetical protein